MLKAAPSEPVCVMDDAVSEVNTPVDGVVAPIGELSIVELVMPSALSMLLQSVDTPFVVRTFPLLLVTGGMMLVDDAAATASKPAATASNSARNAELVPFDAAAGTPDTWL
jgi:hypothetical protein